MSGNILTTWVTLYRALDTPQLNDNLSLDVRVSLSQNLIDALDGVNGSLKENKYYAKGEVNIVRSPTESWTLGEEGLILQNELNGYNNQKANISISFPCNDELRFHKNTASLIEQTGRTGRLHLPEYYYLVSKNYFHGEDDVSSRPSQLSNIDCVIDFATKIYEIADIKGENNRQKTATFYVSDVETKGHIRPITIDLAITPDLLELPISSFSILDSVTVIDEPTSHHHEKKIILKNALYEVINQSGYDSNYLKDLYQNWSTVDLNYHKHLEAFMRGISFNKLRHQVEDRGLAFLNDVNSSLSDISLKLTALPASFAVWLYFARSNLNTIQEFGFAFAIAMMTWLFYNSLNVNREKLTYVEDIIDKQLTVFTSRASGSQHEFDTSVINTEIEVLRAKLQKRVDGVRKSLRTYKIILWLPVILMIFIMYFSDDCEYIFTEIDYLFQDDGKV